MTRFMFFIAAMAILAFACEKEGADNNNSNPEVGTEIVIGDIKPGDINSYVNDLLEKCNAPVNGKEVFEAIRNSGVVIKESYRFWEAQWLYNSMPGQGGVEGFVLDNDNCIFYGYLPIIDATTPDTLTSFPYECTCDEENATIFTKSLSCDYTFAAKVIYFKDNTLIFDGVLGLDDGYSDNYAERRIIYLCTLDSNAPADWEERLGK